MLVWMSFVIPYGKCLICRVVSSWVLLAYLHRAERIHKCVARVRVIDDTDICGIDQPISER